MKNDRVSNEQTSPKKLYKPCRDAGQQRPEEVITYSDECHEEFENLGDEGPL